MIALRFTVAFLPRLSCCGCLLLVCVNCAVVNPLREVDVLKSYSVANHHQCRRLCWYRKPCARFSFYNKNDNHITRGENCVLHLNEEQVHDLLEGWVEGTVSGEALVRME